MRFSFNRFYTRSVIFLSKYLFWIIGFAALALMFTAGSYGYQFLKKINVKPNDLLSIFGPVSENIEKSGDFTHFLLLGIRGDGVDSPNLSDSVIVFSYNHSNSQVFVTSIPRDLWVPSIQAKINTSYHYGEEASPGGGIRSAQAAVLETTGIPINYTAVINFSLFKQLIDLVGGIDIYLEKGFTDEKFPIQGKENFYPESGRYEILTFPSGNIHLDGDLALKFVRSRHSSGEEGTDFARSSRQQLLLNSLRQKLLTAKFLLDKEKVNQIFNLISQNTNSNISPSLYPSLARLALSSDRQQFISIPLSITPDANGISILYHPPTNKYKGEWVLMPKDNNWSALKKYISTYLTSTK